jgi:D-sedoheptulose 7-phosphate isomerase
LDQPTSKAAFFQLLRDSIDNTIVDPEGDFHQSLGLMRRAFDEATKKGNKVIFIGNGGSNAIASHMASDISKNGGVRAVAFNDLPTVTMLGNDYGYEHVFSKQLEFYGFPEDILVAISSSGGSHNILNAARKAREMKVRLFTFTGMVKTGENQLKTMGEINFITPSTDYGIVEVAHLSLIHSVI